MSRPPALVGSGWGLGIRATAKILTMKSKNGQSAKILTRENNQLYAIYDYGRVIEIIIIDITSSGAKYLQVNWQS